MCKTLHFRAAYWLLWLLSLWFCVVMTWLWSNTVFCFSLKFTKLNKNPSWNLVSWSICGFFYIHCCMWSYCHIRTSGKRQRTDLNFSIKSVLLHYKSWCLNVWRDATWRNRSGLKQLPEALVFTWHSGVCLIWEIIIMVVVFPFILHKSVSKLPSSHKRDIAQLVQVVFNFGWSFEPGFGSQLSKYRCLWCFLDNKWSTVGGRARSFCFLLILNFNGDICEVGQKRIKVQWQNDVTQLCTKLICDML